MTILKDDKLNSAVTELAASIGLLYRRGRAVSNAHELSWTQRAVLGRLGKEGPGTVSDLARSECMKPQSMSATVAALEELGLVERQAHPTDGRQVMISISDKGRAVRDQFREERVTWLSNAIDKLSKEEQETLFRAGEIMKRLGEV